MCLDVMPSLLGHLSIHFKHQENVSLKQKWWKHGIQFFRLTIDHSHCYSHEVLL